MPTVSQATLKKTSASHAGFHFINLYQCCPRKFYHKYVLGLSPTFTPPALLGGSAFHEGKAVWYKTKSRAKAINKVKSYLKGVRPQYEHDEVYEKDSFRFPILLDRWIDEYGLNDFQVYKILMVEKELELPIPGLFNKKKEPYVITARADLVVQDDRKNIYVIDTKTSSFSTTVSQNAVYYGDQATMYIWAVSQTLKKPVAGLIADIAYWNKNAVSEGNIACIRGDLTVRSDRVLKEFIEGVASLFMEISQKVEALKKKKFSVGSLFQRNTYYCTAFSRPCEYADVCRLDLTGTRKPPIGFCFEKTSYESPLLKTVDSFATGSHN